MGGGAVTKAQENYTAWLAAGFRPLPRGIAASTGPVLDNIAHKWYVPSAICDGLGGPMFDNELLSNIVGPAGATRPFADTEDTLFEG